MFDAMASDYALGAQLDDIDSASFYASIFGKYNTDKAQFDTTLSWYSGHPEEFADVYNEVFGYIEKQNQDLKEELKVYSRTGLKPLHRLPRTLRCFDTIPYPEPYIIETSEKGTYIIDVRIRLSDKDKSTNPKLLIYFFKNEADESPGDRLVIADMPLAKSNYSRSFQYKYELKNSKYKYLKIIIPDTPDREKDVYRNLQVSKVSVSLIEEKTTELKDEEATDASSDEIDKKGKELPK
jgi:hypothetical protein